MPWPPRQPARSEIAIDELAAYAAVIERATRNKPDPERDGAGFFGRLLLSPRLTQYQSGMGSVVRTAADRGQTYTHADREWIDHVCAARFHTNVLLALHIPDAVAAGVRPEAIAAIRAGRREELTPAEAQITQFIECLLDGAMTKEIWEGLEERMGERGVVEYAIAIIYISGGTLLQQAVGMPDPSDEEVDKLIAQYIEGTTSPPDDWQSRNA